MIRLRERPEPLTPASVEDEPALAESEAYHTLLREIRRYAGRETAGRSFLIAGHRGSGKTTMVRFAVQRAQMEARDGKLKLWPMLISLHGPDILDAENADRPRPAPDAADASSNPAKPGAAKPDPAGAGAESAGTGRGASAAAALRILAKNLHRILADELASGFQRYVEEKTKDWPNSQRGDLLELAAHVEHELDHAPDLAALREYWRRAHALDSGVLSAKHPKWGQYLRAGQGTRELIAIATAIEAFRVVAGTSKNTDKSGDEAAKENTAKFGANVVGKDLFNPLVGAVTGGALGVGMAQANTSPWLAALLSVGAAVAATLTLNYSSLRTRKLERKIQKEFTWDTSIASLDRMLPVLVDRMLQAGIAPIFVIDELDKVEPEKLSEVMDDLIAHLKHFVTERAFFCFLCDRTYYEQIAVSGRSGQYSKEYTFFSDRLFVHYTPAALRKYLGGILVSVPPADTDEVTDMKLLPTVLLQAARLSPIALRRELARFTDAKGDYNLSVGTLRSNKGFQMRAFMQVAVEEVFGERTQQDSEVKTRTKYDPLFKRLVADVVYYPALVWARGAAELNVSEAAVREHLEERLRGDVAERKPASGTGQDPHQRLSQADFRFLHKVLQDLIRHLRNPSELLNKLPPDEGIGTSYIEPFLEQGSSADELRWRIDPYGLPLPKAAVASPFPQPPPASPPAGPGPDPSESDFGIALEATPPAPPPSPVSPPAMAPAAQVAAEMTARRQAAEALVQRYSEGYGRASEIDALEPLDGDVTLERLAKDYCVLELSPAWPQVIGAIQALLVPPPPDIEPADTAAKLVEQVATVGAYTTMLDHRSEILRDALLIAFFCGTFPDVPTGSPLSRALRVVSGLVGLDKMVPAQSAVILQELRDRIWKLSPSRADPKTQEALEKLLRTPRGNQPQWLRDFAAVLREPKLFPARDFILSLGLNISETQNKWAEFLRRNSFGFSTVYHIGVEELVLGLRPAARNQPDILRAFVDGMTLAEWRSLTQANNPNLTRAVLAFLGVGEGLSPRQQRLGQRVALIVRPDNELLRKWTPSRTHAVCLFNAVPPHGSTFAGTAAPSPDFDVLGRLAPTLLLTDVEDFGRIATRLTEEDPRWRKLEALAMPHFPEVTKAATLDDAVAAAIASLNSERPRSPTP